VFSSKTRPFCRDGTEFRKNHGETRILQLTFRFGCTSTRLLATPDEAVLELPHKLLSGPGVESWHLPTMTFCGRSAEDIHWWRSEHHGLAVVHRPVSANTMVDSTRNIYRQLLNGLTDLSPSRFWNFIPGINQVVGELDVYKMFCLGRSEAFAPWSEGHDNTRLPAASAVGTPDDQLTVVMLCTAEPMVPVENPQQIPAYRYPQRYGPRAQVSWDRQRRNCTFPALPALCKANRCMKVIRRLNWRWLVTTSISWCEPVLLQKWNPANACSDTRLNRCACTCETRLIGTSLEISQASDSHLKPACSMSSRQTSADLSYW
jgi:hypothetical protein